MKSYNDLWDKFIDEDNVRESIKATILGKGDRKVVDIVRGDIDWYVEYIIDYAKKFTPKPHLYKIIKDGSHNKERQLVIPELDETVVHHMWVNAALPMLTKGMYKHSYSSIPGKGLHDAVKYIKRRMENDSRHCKYCLQMDIKKFFNSVDIDILKDKLKKHIRDKKFLSIGLEILDCEKEYGLPLGFYTSHWFGNWLLQPLDHYIKEELGANYYIRYMDDMVILGSNKKKLHEIQEKVQNFLEENFGLEIKKNWQVYRVAHKSSSGTKGRAIDFVGFKFYSNGKVTLRKKLFKRMMNKAKKLDKKGKFTLYDSYQMISYMGWMSWADAYQVYTKYIGKHYPITRMKDYVSQYFKKQQERATLYLQNKEECYEYPIS